MLTSRTSLYVYIFLSDCPRCCLPYWPTKKPHLDDLSSVAVWAKVYAAIIANDMSLADKEKKIVEQEQRDRSKAKAATNKQFNGRFFDMDNEGHWDFKNN